MSVITDGVYKKLGSPPLTPANPTLKGPSNEALKVKGRLTTQLLRDNHETEQELYVAEGLQRPLLGRPAIQALQLVQRIRDVQTEKLNPVQQFPKLFPRSWEIAGGVHDQTTRWSKTICPQYSQTSSNPIEKVCKSRARAHGEARCHISSQRANRLVRWHGGGAKAQWPGENLC